MRLFSDFYDADVIVASPIGLAALLAEQKGTDASTGAADFLSSIEICIVDRADVLLMQNWAHVRTGLHPFLQKFTFYFGNLSLHYSCMMQRLSCELTAGMRHASFALLHQPYNI